jgi:hypothetical protein
MSSPLETAWSRAMAPFRSFAGRLATVERLPTSARAVFSHFAKGGALEFDAIGLKSRVDEGVEEMVDSAFGPVEEAIGAEFDYDPGAVDFEYETKLLRPAELTLGRLYRDARARAEDGFDPVAREVRSGIGGRLAGLAGVASSDPIEPEFSHLIRDVEHAERVTELVVVALLDGDMRDAINDDEYDDFRTAMPTSDSERRRIAGLAQSILEADVERRFERFPGGVREAYDRAVDVSEAHQDDDDEFRELLASARNGDRGAEDRIRDRYRDADFEDPPDYFAPGDLDLPYLRTQYGRVGVIYEGMIEMYREAGVEIDDAFQRSIVLSIVGAQIWLDDVDDFEADMAGGQLTPVTAEYLLADSDAEAYRRICDLTDRYLGAARRHAVASDAPLTAIAIEYIRHSGSPSVLPGSEAADLEPGTAPGTVPEAGEAGTNAGTGTPPETRPEGGSGAEPSGSRDGSRRSDDESGRDESSRSEGREPDESTAGGA